MTRLFGCFALLLAAGLGLGACRGGVRLPVRGSPCAGDRDCGPTYVCSPQTRTCQWPGPSEPPDGGADQAGKDTAPDARVVAEASTGASPDVALDGPVPDTAVVVDVAFDRSPDLAPARSPAEVAGLAFWFDAAVGVTAGADGRVSGWQDRSPYQHLARPRAVGPVALGDAGGHPALSFGLAGPDLVALYIDDHQSLRWNRDDFTIAAVLRHRNRSLHANQPEAYGMIYAKVQSEVSPYIGPQLYANDPWPSYLGTGPTSTAFRFQLLSNPNMGVATRTEGYDDNNRHVVVLTRRKSLLVLRVDGIEVGSNFTALIEDIGNPGVDVVIGSNPTRPQQQLVGELYQLAGFGSAARESELAGVERYLLERYQVPVQLPRDR